MCESTLAIYCFIDDFLKASGHREDCRVEVTDAEVITIALTAMLSFGGNFERARLILHELGLMRRLLSRSRFSRRLSRLADLIHCLFHRLGSALKDFHWETRYMLDSFPVAVCDNKRATAFRSSFVSCPAVVLTCRAWRNWRFACPLMRNCLSMPDTITTSGKIIWRNVKICNFKCRAKPIPNALANRGWKAVNRSSENTSKRRLAKLKNCFRKRFMRLP